MNNSTIFIYSIVFIRYCIIFTIFLDVYCYFLLLLFEIKNVFKPIKPLLHLLNKKNKYRSKNTSSKPNRSRDNLPNRGKIKVMDWSIIKS